MHYCIDRPDLMQLLLDSGATIEGRDSKGKTPLHCAFGIRRTYLDSVDYLIHAGADIEARDSQVAHHYSVRYTKADQPTQSRG